MKAIQKYKHFYFLGIGGVGMSGIAAWLHNHNKTVSGYDRKTSPYTSRLEKLGISIQYNKLTNNIPDKFLNNHDTLVVYTPAVSDENSLYNFFHLKGFDIVKRSDVLHQLSKKYTVIAIAGTHGKTTISIMLSHILRSSGFNPSAFFGGISNNYSSNFLIGTDKYMIIEADEYDKSFLKLSPTISLISAIDSDHSETYKSENEMLQAYYQFTLNTIQSVSPKLFMTKSVMLQFKSFLPQKEMTKLLRYTCYLNDCLIKPQFFQNLCDHNIKNALAASSIALYMGLGQKQIKNAFKTFKGVSRRFEYHINTKKCVFIDDYAHHPEEIKALIISLRKMYPSRDVFLIFQPHLFSRTRDLELDFVDSLSLSDKLVLLDIYPARELPIEGVSSQSLFSKINLEYKWHVQSQDLFTIIKQESPDLIITAGAGDIHTLIPKIKSLLI